MEPELVVHPIRWNLAPIAGENHWARNWLLFQSNRGLAPNTLEAYVRGIEIYFAFRESGKCYAGRGRCLH